MTNPGYSSARMNWLQPNRDSDDPHLQCHTVLRRVMAGFFFPGQRPEQGGCFQGGTEVGSGERDRAPGGVAAGPTPRCSRPLPTSAVKHLDRTDGGNRPVIVIAATFVGRELVLYDLRRSLP